MHNLSFLFLLTMPVNRGLAAYLTLILILFLLPLFTTSANDAATADQAVEQSNSDNEGDDTPDVETETTADSTAGKGLRITGDLRH